MEAQNRSNFLLLRKRDRKTASHFSSNCSKRNPSIDQCDQPQISRPTGISDRRDEKIGRPRYARVVPPPSSNRSLN